MKKAEPGFSAGALGRTLTQRLGATSSLKVAYSGGLDSHVLLHALCHLRASAHWVISAIHVDHGLHHESARWAEHCQQVCEQLGVVCTVERIQISDTDSLGTEAAARRLRYACFAQHIRYQDALLTAHHLDDQAETVLLQLLRGTGVRGLAGMPEVTAFSGGKLVRPLLEFTRAELAAYAESQGLHWVEDVSNRDVSYGRNFLRHQVLPLLEQRWPQASRLIARAGRHAGEASTLLDAFAASDLRTAAPAGGCTLSVPALLRLAPERRHNLLRYWVRLRGFAAPPAQLLLRLAKMTEVPTRSHHAAVSWPGAEVRRYRDALWIMKPLTDPDPSLSLPWDPGKPLKVPGTGYVMRTEEAVGNGLAHTRIATRALSVRLRRGGESCRLPGREHHHKLKKLLQDAGIPPWERQRLPLVFVDDVLAAIGDRWVCEPFAARAGETALRVVLEHREKRD